MSCPECKIVSIGKGHDALCYECAIKRIEELKAQVAELRDTVKTAYFKGHEDTVEGCFAWCDEGSQEVVDDLIAAALEAQ